jgi:hypothetical protein
LNTTERDECSATTTRSVGAAAGAAGRNLHAGFRVEAAV